MTDRPEEAVVVEPPDPFEGGELDVFDATPGAPPPAAVRERFARSQPRLYGGGLQRLRNRNRNEELREFAPFRRAFNETGSPGALTVVHMVLAQRVIRAWAAGHLARLGELAPTLDTFGELDHLLAEAEARLRMLWPSEQAHFRRQVDGARMTMYATATAELEEARRRVVASLREPAQGGDREAHCVFGLVHANPDLALNAEQRALNRMLVPSGHGLRVTPEDQAQAAVWFRRAADQGDAFAQNDLGLLYSAGRGVDRDDQEAAQWYRRAADQGHVFAQHNLASAYAAGRGVRQDARKAVDWYARAARAGYAPSQHQLARAYEAGRGVTQSYQSAAEWYRQAAEQGHAHAQNDLGVLFREGRGVIRDEAQAQLWFRQAADGGSAQGRANLERAEQAAREAQREPTFLEALAGFLVLCVAAAALSGPGDATPPSDHDEWRMYHDERRFKAEQQMGQIHIDAMTCC